MQFAPKLVKCSELNIAGKSGKKSKESVIIPINMAPLKSNISGYNVSIDYLIGKDESQNPPYTTRGMSFRTIIWKKLSKNLG